MHDVLDVTKAPGMKSRAKNRALGNAANEALKSDQVICDGGTEN